MAAKLEDLFPVGRMQCIREIHGPASGAAAADVDEYDDDEFVQENAGGAAGRGGGGGGWWVVGGRDGNGREEFDLEKGVTREHDDGSIRNGQICFRSSFFRFFLLSFSFCL